MANLTEARSEEYAFEAAQEVWDKMQSANDLHELIPEENVQYLEAVDVSGKFYNKVKRLIDILFSGLGLAMLLLPMVLVAAAVYLDDPGEVFFVQYRVGRKGKRFKVYKFRTMKMDTPKYRATMELENPDQYLTRIGHFLRKYSLDEIPQLVNVLKGDMSLVGPRPLISDEYEIHAMRMRFGVYNIRPGVTGLAQINGRDLVSPEEKVRWDVQYLHEFGPWMDLKILLATIPKIVDGHDVVEGVENEMEQEIGNENTGSLPALLA